MKSVPLAGVVAAAFFVTALPAVVGHAQPQVDTVDDHITAAKVAASRDHWELYSTLCAPDSIGPPPKDPAPRPVAATRPGPPPKASWHAEPARVFDNLFFIGQTEYSAWALKTSAGLIVIDTLFDYSVDDEVVGGLTKLGLDPSDAKNGIKYVIVSHGHFDHSGGAKFLQDRFNARVILSAPDWDMLDRMQDRPKPKRDLVAEDGQKLTLGDTTMTMYLTPGHTPGTLSYLIPVTDGGVPHLVAEWGGTAFNFPHTAQNFRTYRASALRFRDIAVKAGADVIIANHTNFDESTRKLPALAARKPGGPNPYVIGTEAVDRYMTIAIECSTAALVAMGER